MKFDAHKLVQLARPSYFDGQLLTADDFRAEQNFVREKFWLHNRMLHGYGIVAGLDVAVQENENGEVNAVIAPGYALDGYGRELIVPEALPIAVARDRHDFVVFLKYAETDDPHSLVPTMNDGMQATRILETVQVLFEPPAERTTSPTQRDDFAIPIARLRKPSHQWQHDRNFRPPRAK